jgi:phosphohistidine phosphatase
MSGPYRYLWLLRHAKTVTDPPPGGTDFDRVLAPRGRRDATALGQLFLGGAEKLVRPKAPFPELALVSPAARTTATAQLALDLLSQPPVTELVPAFYNADPEDVMDHLRGLSAEVTSVMVVGHNPTAHSLATGLISRDDKAGRALAERRGFPTCALGVYRFSVEQWSEVHGASARLLGLLIPPFGEE